MHKSLLKQTDGTILQLALKFLTIAVLYFASPCHASFLHWPERSLQPELTDLFLPDNEHYPQDASGILGQTVTGVYLAVGTERGFNNFAYSGATHLLLVDYNPAAVLYNRLTILLLKGARDIETYRQLKTNRQFLLLQLPKLRLSQIEIQQARTIAESEWYSLATSSTVNDHFEVNLIWQEPSAGGPYDSANYVFDNSAFLKVQAAARAGLIQAELVDLADMDDVRKISEQMLNARLAFSMLDLSNAWETHFIGPENMPAILSAFKLASQPQTLMMVTQSMGRSTKGFRWKYKGGPLPKDDCSRFLFVNH